MDDNQLIQQWELEVRDIDDRFICHPSQQRWSSDERWERLEMLGRGGYGEVWLQKCTTGPRVGDLRAVKEIPKDVTKASEDGHAKIRHQELSALIKFSHQQALFITMQYFPQGDLQSHIAQALPNEEACTITRQILQGLSFMHQNKFAHRDLKPANILVQEKGPNWWIKLSDFGCSKEATTLRTTVGTPPYWAPELCHIFTRADEDAYDFVEHRTYSFQVDIWSAGVIAFRLATGVLPFGRNLHSELYCYVRRGSSLPSSPLLTDQSRPFMESLMSRSPGDRPTAT
ncbi:kinase-like domain-containing protein [Fusarium solani]|uniref:Kinase-like domain-containing protein n=1 Tax=Fusarium solani TaxID=169388 RepID=A0A9P9KT55_FUSSL|nr:kinase-like domain-containing protein [Fusarium solani]KAH7268051.1 kinase-like domain-containing protein [Fusarium solani]